jgi:hypothetical protein
MNTQRDVGAGLHHEQLTLAFAVPADDRRPGVSVVPGHRRHGCSALRSRRFHSAGATLLSVRVRKTPSRDSRGRFVASRPRPRRTGSYSAAMATGFSARLAKTPYRRPYQYPFPQGDTSGNLLSVAPRSRISRSCLYSSSFVSSIDSTFRSQLVSTLLVARGKTRAPVTPLT